MYYYFVFTPSSSDVPLRSTQTLIRRQLAAIRFLQQCLPNTTPLPQIPEQVYCSASLCAPLKSEEPYLQLILWPFSLFANVKFALKIYEVLIPFFGFVYRVFGCACGCSSVCVYVCGYVILCFFVCVRELPFPVANIVGLLRWQVLV